MAAFRLGLSGRRWRERGSWSARRASRTRRRSARNFTQDSGVRQLLLDRTSTADQDGLAGVMDDDLGDGVVGEGGRVTGIPP